MPSKKDLKIEDLTESIENALIVMQTLQAQVEDYSSSKSIEDVETGITLNHDVITDFIKDVKQELSDND